METPKGKLKEAIDWLIENHYLVSLNNQLFVTSRVYRDLELDLKVVPTDLKILAKQKRYKEEDFKTFITEVAVPAFVTTNSGGRYRCNSYSSSAAKEFVKILQSGISYEILVQAGKRYYKGNSMPKTIGNFILEELWRTPYDEILSGVRDAVRPSDHRKML